MLFSGAGCTWGSTVQCRATAASFSLCSSINTPGALRVLLLPISEPIEVTESDKGLEKKPRRLVQRGLRRLFPFAPALNPHLHLDYSGWVLCRCNNEHRRTRRCRCALRSPVRRPWGGTDPPHPPPPPPKHPLSFSALGNGSGAGSSRLFSFPAGAAPVQQWHRGTRAGGSSATPGTQRRGQGWGRGVCL